MTSKLPSGMQKASSSLQLVSGLNRQLKKQQRHIYTHLYSRGERLVTGHSVAELLEKSKTHDEEFDSLITIGAFLDRFYIPTRYPNSLPSGIPAHAYRPKDASEAIELAQKILEFVSEKITESKTS